MRFHPARPWTLAVAAAIGLAAPAAALAGVGAHSGPGSRVPAAATLEECTTAIPQLERSATFGGEMTALPGSARMLMRVQVLERGTGEERFHAISYPGLGSWLRAAPAVKTFKNLDRVTDLFAPAEYRAEISFRWLTAHGHQLRLAVLRTPACHQSVPDFRQGSHASTMAGGAGAQ